MKKPKPPIKKPLSEMSASELEEAVRYHNYLYFEKNAPVISDYEFDRLVQRLKELKPDSPILSELPSEGEERPKVLHREPMLSLEKAYSEEEVQKWAAKFEGSLIVSPKIDGLAVEIRYETSGDMELAVTRGNGIQGDLITENIRMIDDVPKSLPQGDLEVRGEIYMRLSVFKKRFQDQFANPRNLAAGAVKQKDPRRTKDYQLSFFAYDLKGADLKSVGDKFAMLETWKIPTVEIKKARRNEIEKFYQYFLEKRDTYDFETDGVVFQADDLSEQQRLGSTAHHPRYSIAYKYQGDSGVTTLKDVEWNVARSGVITPIGIVEPVELSGAMVSRVSLHNYGLMSEKKLRKGAKVIMVRRGGVIPYLESVQERGQGESYKSPKQCPSCGSTTEVRDEFLYCSNAEGCTQAKIAELEHFIKTVEIDGFGSKLVTRLYESGFVTEPADYYDLTKENLLQIERMGDKLATKLIRNVQDKRTLDFETFLTSLGMREVGKQVARVIASRFGSFKALRKATEEELTTIDMVGPIIAQELITGLEAKKESIDRLLERISVKSVEKKTQEGPLAEKKFCFTATLSSMSRNEAQKKVEALGGIATNTVTKDLDYLVVGSEGAAGSKLTKAEKLISEEVDLKIIGEKEFLRLVGK